MFTILNNNLTENFHELSFKRLETILAEELRLNRLKQAALVKEQINLKQILRNYDNRVKFSKTMLSQFQRKENYNKKEINENQIRYKVLLRVFLFFKKIVNVGCNKVSDISYNKSNIIGHDVAVWNIAIENMDISTPYEFVFIIYQELLNLMIMLSKNSREEENISRKIKIYHNKKIYRFSKPRILNDFTKISIIKVYSTVIDSKNDEIIVGIMHRKSEFGEFYKTLVKWLSSSGKCIFCEDRDFLHHLHLDDLKIKNT